MHVNMYRYFNENSKNESNEQIWKSFAKYEYDYRYFCFVALIMVQKNVIDDEIKKKY